MGKKITKQEQGVILFESMCDPRVEAAPSFRRYGALLYNEIPQALKVRRILNPEFQQLYKIHYTAYLKREKEIIELTEKVVKMQELINSNPGMAQDLIEMKQYPFYPKEIPSKPSTGRERTSAALSATKPSSTMLFSFGNAFTLYVFNAERASLDLPTVLFVMCRDST